MDDTHNIGTPETLDLADVNLYHRNPRVGDVQAIVASLRANGVYKPVVVNKGTFTGRPLEVLAGNHTVKAHRQLAEEEPGDERWTRLAAWVVDVDDDRAARIVLADNRTADLGSYDNEVLIDLLETVDHDLDGTGYDYEFLEILESLYSEDPLSPDGEDESLDEGNTAEDAGEDGGEGDEEGPEDVGEGEEFKSFDEDIETDYRCPKCHYEWSGAAK